MRVALLLALMMLGGCPNNDTEVTDSGSTTDTGEIIDRDGDGFPAGEDCNDDPAGCGADCFPGNPAADECDGQDNDCDDSVDEDEAASWYADCDGDGVYSDTVIASCGEPTDHTCDDGAAADSYTSTPPTTADCDDEDADANYDDADGDGTSTCDGDCDDDPEGCGSLCEPGNTAADTCDGFDVDCDGTIGEDDGLTWYPDCDGDGDYSATGITSCVEPTTSPCTDGATPDGGFTPSVPSQPDCDDEDASANHDDVDTDGVSSCDGDCDDDPGACGDACSPNLTTDGCDGYNNDCDAGTDENPDIDWYLDADGDQSTVGSGTLSCTAPSADHIAGASAEVDCDDGNASQNTRDDDEDGETTCDGDCDDDPNACGDQCKSTNTVDGCDSYDNDCDSAFDENPGSTVWYLDDDEDGWIASTTGIGQCESPGAKYTTRLTTVDCNDGDASLNYDDEDEDSVSTCDGDCDDDPQACGAACSPDLTTDSCDSYNNDCDSATDEDPPTWYEDGDEDGYTGNNTTAACTSPGSKWTTTPSTLTDCNDASAVENHSDADGDQVTSCDGDCDDDPLACGSACSPDLTVDACDPSNYNNDCDGNVDENAPDWYFDDDQDGWSADLTGQQACSSPGADWSQTVSNLADCDDEDAALNHSDEDSDTVTTCDGDCDDLLSGCGAGCYPGNTAPDVCDDDNQDCDENVDENPEIDWYFDDDQDGWSADLTATLACDSPGADWSRTASNLVDCDDNNASLNHDDEDSDTVTSCDGDCDDLLSGCGADCYPGNTDPDICDGDNQDCDENVDENPEEDWFLDFDEDGSTVATATFACSSPGSTYLANASNPVDCDDGDASLNYADADSDSVTSCDGDCADRAEDLTTEASDAGLTAGDINPNATETWYDGADQDCGEDNDFDQDGDGYVAEGYDAEAGGTAFRTGDCDDDPTDDGSNFLTAFDIHPNGIELCDGLDNNCSGSVDGNWGGVLNNQAAMPMFYPDSGGIVGYDIDDSPVTISEPGDLHICQTNDADFTIDSNGVTVSPPTTNWQRVDGDITFASNRTGGVIERLEIDGLLTMESGSNVTTNVGIEVGNLAQVDGTWTASQVVIKPKSNNNQTSGKVTVGSTGELTGTEFITRDHTGPTSAIRVEGVATFYDLFANNNTGSALGGVIHTTADSELVLGFPQLSNNHATDSGGAIYANGDVWISSCEMTDNSAASRGSEIYVGPTGSLTTQNWSNNFVTTATLGIFTNQSQRAMIHAEGPVSLNGTRLRAWGTAGTALYTTSTATVVDSSFQEASTFAVWLEGAATADLTRVNFSQSPWTDNGTTDATCGLEGHIRLTSGATEWWGHSGVTSVTGSCGPTCDHGLANVCRTQ